VTAVATYYFGSLGRSDIAGTLITWNIISVRCQTADRYRLFGLGCSADRAGRGPP